MGNSTNFFRNKALSAGDYYVEGWLYFLACEIDGLPEKPDWLLEAQNYWNVSARVGYGGCVAAGLDDYLTTAERVQIILQLAHATMTRLKTYGREVGVENVRDLGNAGYPDLADPKSYFYDANPVKLCQFGTLFCELLEETLHPAKERIMRGYGAFRYGYLVDYLDTLIPDGENATSSIHLDVHGEEQIDLRPAVYWLSDKNSSAHFTTFERGGVPKHGYCIGMPDLMIDVFPVTPWFKERIAFDVHELYSLQEHWYIDDEEHTVTVRRLVDGKLVVVDVLRAGEEFTSTSLGGKVVQVDELLRME